MFETQQGITLRRAIRIYGLLKLHCGPIINTTEEAKSTLYAHNVSRHNVNKYLPFLIEHKFIGQSKKGELFLRGTRWMVEQNKEYKRMGLIGIDVNAFAGLRVYEDHLAALFKRFIAGQVYYGQASETNRKNQEHYAEEMKTKFGKQTAKLLIKKKYKVRGVTTPERLPLRAPGGSMVQLSNELIHKFAPTRSKMTISRWRKRATVQHPGVSGATRVQKLGVALPSEYHAKFLALGGNWKAMREYLIREKYRIDAPDILKSLDVNRLTMYNGVLSIQLPSMVTFDPVPMRLKGSWYGSHLPDRKDSRRFAGMSAGVAKKKRRKELRDHGFVEDENIPTIYLACKARSAFYHFI